MIRQPDLKKVAEMLRSIVAENTELLSHQKSLNLAAAMFGYKSWAHYEREKAAQPKALRPAPVSENELTLVKETLEWVARNYERTLSGQPVRDADECLVSAKKLLAAAPASEKPALEPFTFITETRALGDFNEGPGWVELTIDQRFLDKVLSMQELCVNGGLDEASVGWNFENWHRSEKFQMRGDSLVVSPSGWHVRAYPKNGDYFVESPSMSISALLKAIASRDTDGKPSQGAFHWHDGVLLFSASWNAGELLDMLIDGGVLKPSDPLQPEDEQSMERIAAQFELATGQSGTLAQEALKTRGLSAGVAFLNESHDIELGVGPWLIANDSEKGFWCNGFGWTSSRMAATGYDEASKPEQLAALHGSYCRWIRFSEAFDYDLDS